MEIAKNIVMFGLDAVEKNLSIKSWLKKIVNRNGFLRQFSA